MRGGRIIYTLDIYKISQSHSIADEMAKLSMYAAQGNVKEMVYSLSSYHIISYRIISYRL